ncbi:MAG TPA: Gfo/Idh/MocA family oxidoreductase [Chloroflexota bacterium]
MGRKRAAALGPHRLVACADLEPELARQLAAGHPGCDPERTVQDLMQRSDVEAVLVCTTNDALAQLATVAVEAGKHVLLEKPGARRLAELQGLRAAADRYGSVVKVGYNHRFHPALAQAQQLFRDGAIGDLMYIRGRYGHGGRAGYEREWRASREISGGGELLDQGCHLIDLARWFAGDFTDVSGRLGTWFWPMAVEDNAFISLATDAAVVAWLHASWTEWKNTFSFEVFGRSGKLQVDGLGGSYGPERLTWYRKLASGAPQAQTFEYPAEDMSWSAEIEHFAECIEQQRQPEGNLDDAAAVLDIIEQLYARSSHGFR